MHVVQQRIESDYLTRFFVRDRKIARDFLTDCTKSVKHAQYVVIESIIHLRFKFDHLFTFRVNLDHMF